MWWKDIYGWEGLYEVNTLGEVRNKLTGHKILGDINSSGYYRVCLYCKNHVPSKQRFFRHRLVANHFIDNPLNLPEVNHLDLDKSNNCISNLEWTNKKENEHHSRINGTKPYKPIEVIWNNNTKSIFETREELANKLGLTRGMISHWLKNRNDSYHKYGIKEIGYKMIKV